jgi:poly-beta-1,6-N-acetyl-D-glucosamine N-deacetylase
LGFSFRNIGRKQVQLSLTVLPVCHKQGKTMDHYPGKPTRKPMHRFIAVAALLMGLLALLDSAPTALTPPVIANDNSAVVLLYHRFGEDKYPSTNIRMNQLENQIAQLKSGGYHFMSLSAAVDALKSDTAFPSRTVILTVDDAYLSFANNGWPLLKAAGIPVTLFVATDPVDTASSNYMGWDDVRRLQKEGVEIGHHTASHLHMVASGLEAGMADIRRASKRFEAELGTVPKILAYPYGEYDKATATAIEAEGFEAAFAQYSGPIAPWQKRFMLPRFPVNERYGDAARFKLISQSLALPIGDLIPKGPLLTATTNPPLLGFTVETQAGSLRSMACYPSHLGRAATLNFLGSRRVEVRFEKPFPKGRNRINCTMPAGGGRWYWFGQFYLVPGGKLD